MRVAKRETQETTHLSATLHGRVFDGTQLRLDGWRADYGISSQGQVFTMDLGYVF